MTRLDRLWTLEWEHESNAPLKTKSIEARAGTLRHIVECGEYHSWACEITLTGEVEHLELYGDYLRQIDDGLTTMGFGRIGKGGLLDVVRFAQPFPQLLTGHIEDPLLGESMEDLLKVREDLVDSGAIRQQGSCWIVDVWHPKLRDRHFVTYERRGKTLVQEMEGHIASGWGKVIAEVMRLPVVKVKADAEGIWSAALAHPCCADRLLGRTLGEPRKTRHWNVRVQCQDEDPVVRANIVCGNPNRMSGGLELLLNPMTGMYLFLDLGAFVEPRRRFSMEDFLKSRSSKDIAPFCSEGATWTRRENVTNFSLEGDLALDLDILRRAAPEAILAEGLLEP